MVFNILVFMVLTILFLWFFFFFVDMEEKAHCLHSYVSLAINLF